MLLAMAERRLGLADNLARVFPDRRDPTRVVHSLVDMFRARMFAICCGYEDADDLDHLRSDPAFKFACGRLPDTGRDLCSQPTLSRLEKLGHTVSHLFTWFLRIFFFGFGCLTVWALFFAPPGPPPTAAERAGEQEHRVAAENAKKQQLEIEQYLCSKKAACKKYDQIKTRMCDGRKF